MNNQQLAELADADRKRAAAKQFADYAVQIAAGIASNACWSIPPKDEPHYYDELRSFLASEATRLAAAVLREVENYKPE